MLFKILRYCIHLGGVIPLLWLIYEINFNLVSSFGTDPIKEIIHFLGYTALLFLLILFSFRIITQCLRQPILLPLHRSLGLWGLFWLSLHIVGYLALELGFDFQLFISEIVSRTYLQIGFIAMILLVLIALSSIPYIKRRLGKRGFSLHQLSLLVVVLAAIHYYLSLKAYNIDSLLFLALCGVFVLWKTFARRVLAWCYR